MKVLIEFSYFIIIFCIGLKNYTVVKQYNTVTITI